MEFFHSAYAIIAKVSAIFAPFCTSWVITITSVLKVPVIFVAGNLPVSKLPVST